MRRFKIADIAQLSSSLPIKLVDFSFYMGVLVLWDEDHDTRVLGFIEDMRPDDRDELLIISEHEASLSMAWDLFIPRGYQEGDEISAPDGDIWNVYFSRSTPCAEPIH